MPSGVAQTRQRFATIYRVLDHHLATHPMGWAVGGEFTMADCAAAPALSYADRVLPFSGQHPHLAAYFERLMARPSFARAVAEAKPYFHLFPQG